MENDNQDFIQAVDNLTPEEKEEIIKRINAFKEATENGTKNEFLSKIPCRNKLSLLIEMKRNGEEQKYLDIIKKAISEDLERSALLNGASSVEEWIDRFIGETEGIKNTTERLSDLNITSWQFNPEADNYEGKKRH